MRKLINNLLLAAITKGSGAERSSIANSAPAKYWEIFSISTLSGIHRWAVITQRHVKVKGADWMQQKQQQQQ